MKRLIILFAALLLSACYDSDQLLLDPDAAVRPLADGLYVRQGGDKARFQLTQEPDGWYRVEAVEADGLLGESHRVLVTRASAGGANDYVIAAETPDGFVYAVAHLDGRRVFLATPDCADSLDRSLALDQGATGDEDEPMTRRCHFKTRDAVLPALAAFAGSAEFGAPYLRQ